MKKIIITESEKNRILGLHNSKTKVIKEATVKDIQTALVDKGYQLGNTGDGRGVDGILGNKTLTAIEQFLSSTVSKPEESPIEDIEPIKPIEVQQIPTTTPELTIKTPTEPVLQPSQPASVQPQKPKLGQRIRDKFKRNK
jgi:hypothetical protein